MRRLQVGLSVAAHIMTANFINVEPIQCNVTKESVAWGNIAYELHSPGTLQKEVESPILKYSN